MSSVCNQSSSDSTKQRPSSSHIQALYALFRRRNNGPAWFAFGQFLNSLFNLNNSVLKLRLQPCRHQHSRPNGFQPCGTSGTSEEKKSPGIRVSRIRALARSWIKDHPRMFKGKIKSKAGQTCLDKWISSCKPLNATLEVSLEPSTQNSEQYASSDVQTVKISTKMRVPHLAILAYSFELGGEKALRSAYLKIIDPNIMVLHNCGCGLLPGGGCCEGSHLRFGTQSENEADKHFHYILDLSIKHPKGDYIMIQSQLQTLAGFAIL